MAEDNEDFILKILEDLRPKEMRKLKAILNREKIGNCKLDKLDAIKATELLRDHFDKPLETLKCILDKIPRKDLIKEINDKIEADKKNKGEVQNNETCAVINSCPGSSDHPTYTGKYTLFDLEDYATKHQDQLIMDLENILEPDEFNELKKQLMCSVLNTVFSFTAQKYYELYKNGDVSTFLKNIPDKPKKIPMKILNILFSKKKNNRKRKVQEQMQREGNINLKKKRFVNIDDDDDSVPDKVTIEIENDKIILIHPIEHKPRNEDSNVIEEHGLGEDSRMATGNKYEKNENEKIIPIHPIEHKPGNENSNVIEEDWPDEESRMAIEKWYENKIKNNYMEKISLNYICLHEHRAYACFTAQDVLQFRLPNDPDYRILAILQEKRDLTNSRKLKKEVEFALQFNMAVLNVQYSEVICSTGFFCEIEVDDSFAKYERIFKNIVFKIVLPVLALYKRVKLNAFDNAVYPNKESKSSFSEKL